MRMGAEEGFIMKNFIVSTVHLNKIRMIKSIRLRWAGHVARMEEGRSTLNISRVKSTGNKPLGRSKGRQC